jgi:hypothetical protein
VADEAGSEVATSYWKEVNPGWNRDEQDLQAAAQRLVQAKRPRAAFQFVHFDLKKLAPAQVFDLLVAIATASDEPPKTYMLDEYHLRQAFRLLDESGEIAMEKMAGLEFQYISVFDDEVKPTNLARCMAAQPELFVQAVAFAFKRSDDGVDPPELLPDDPEARSNRALTSYQLLDRIELMPGEKDGKLGSARLVAWIERAQTLLDSLARREIGDQMIGKILSKAAAAEDKTWPCMPVRDALEHVANEEIGRGLAVALRNARGAHFRGVGGDQERELAAKYRGWAQAMEYTHPHVAAMMFDLEKSYLREAEWEDNEARIQRRMRN